MSGTEYETNTWFIIIYKPKISQMTEFITVQLKRQFQMISLPEKGKTIS